MTKKKINNKIQTQFIIFFVKVSYSISYCIQSKFIEYLIVIVVNHRGFEIPRFHISSFFLKFYCQSIFFRNINFVDIFLLPLVLTMTNYDIFNLSILSWFLLLLVTLLSVFVAKTEVMGKAFQESFTSRRFFILAVTF